MQLDAIFVILDRLYNIITRNLAKHCGCSGRHLNPTPVWAGLILQGYHVSAPLPLRGLHTPHLGKLYFSLGGVAHVRPVFDSLTHARLASSLDQMMTRTVGIGVIQNGVPLENELSAQIMLQLYSPTKWKYAKWGRLPDTLTKELSKNIPKEQTQTQQ